MFAPINPEHERMRAEAIVNSLTDYNKAVEVFAPKQSEAERNCDQDEAAEHSASNNNGSSIMRVFNALKLSRRSMLDESQPVYSPRRVPTPGGSR